MPKFHIFILIMFCATISFAQETTLKGKVTGSDVFGSEPTAFVGVNILVKNTTTGTSTGTNGEFSFNVNNLPVELVFSYIGYEKKTITVSSESFLDVLLVVDVYGSDDVLIVGSRFRPRTSITSPVPIDNIKLKDLFNGDRIFNVPKYQRAYAWETNNLKDFLDDLLNQRGEKSYFLGTILFHQKPNNKF